MVLASFIFFLLCFVVIGVSSIMLSRHNNADYLLASSAVKPWLVALSAVATNNSGYMFVGLIGFTYVAGLHASWLMIGWVFGDFLSSLFIHRKLRIHTESTGSLSFAGVLAQWSGQNFKIFRFVAGLITVAFLATYAAAQLNAGSKALNVLLGWDYSVGAILGAIIVVAYCFAGGIRASIWTDAAQSFVMIVAMGLMFFTSIYTMGGWGGFTAALHDVSPEYMNIFPSDLAYGPLMFVMGWVFAGIGVIGQPHIMVRFMTMDTPESMKKVRLYYYSWFSVFSVLAIGAGLASRLILPFEADFDAELALPSLAFETLPPVLVGLVLAGLFAATISTADSQILSCTAAISRDLTGGRQIPYYVTKISTVSITLVSLLIALFGDDSVFILVLIAWSALAASFGPLLIVYAFGGKPGQWQAIVMMLAGLATVIIWREMGLSDDIYEIMPGMLAGLIVYGVTAPICTIIKKRRDNSPEQPFQE